MKKLEIGSLSLVVALACCEYVKPLLTSDTVAVVAVEQKDPNKEDNKNKKKKKRQRANKGRRQSNDEPSKPNKTDPVVTQKIEPQEEGMGSILPPAIISKEYVDSEKLKMSIVWQSAISYGTSYGGLQNAPKKALDADVLACMTSIIADNTAAALPPLDRAGSDVTRSVASGFGMRTILPTGYLPTQATGSVAVPVSPRHVHWSPSTVSTRLAAASAEPESWKAVIVEMQHCAVEVNKILGVNLVSNAVKSAAGDLVYMCCVQDLSTIKTENINAVRVENATSTRYPHISIQLDKEKKRWVKIYQGNNIPQLSGSHWFSERYAKMYDKLKLYATTQFDNGAPTLTPTSSRSVPIMENNTSRQHNNAPRLTHTAPVMAAGSINHEMQHCAVEVNELLKPFGITVTNAVKMCENGSTSYRCFVSNLSSIQTQRAKTVTNGPYAHKALSLDNAYIKFYSEDALNYWSNYSLSGNHNASDVSGTFSKLKLYATTQFDNGSSTPTSSRPVPIMENNTPRQHTTSSRLTHKPVMATGSTGPEMQHTAVEVNELLKPFGITVTNAVKMCDGYGGIHYRCFVHDLNKLPANVRLVSSNDAGVCRSISPKWPISVEFHSLENIESCYKRFTCPVNNLPKSTSLSYDATSLGKAFSYLKLYAKTQLERGTPSPLTLPVMENTTAKRVYSTPVMERGHDIRSHSASPRCLSPRPTAVAVSAAPAESEPWKAVILEMQHTAVEVNELLKPFGITVTNAVKMCDYDRTSVDYRCVVSDANFDVIPAKIVKSAYGAYKFVQTGENTYVEFHPVTLIKTSCDYYGAKNDKYSKKIFSYFSNLYLYAQTQFERGAPSPLTLPVMAHDTTKRAHSTSVMERGHDVKSHSASPRCPSPRPTAVAVSTAPAESELRRTVIAEMQHTAAEVNELLKPFRVFIANILKETKPNGSVNHKLSLNTDFVVTNAVKEVKHDGSIIYRCFYEEEDLPEIKVAKDVTNVYIHPGDQDELPKHKANADGLHIEPAIDKAKRVLQIKKKNEPTIQIDLYTQKFLEMHAMICDLRPDMPSDFPSRELQIYAKYHQDSQEKMAPVISSY